MPASAAPATEAPFGAWVSPIAAEQLAAGAVKLGELTADHGKLYWIESKPEQRGRMAVMTLAADGSPVEISPESFNARTRVHEYGGAAFAASAGQLFATQFADQRLYNLSAGAAPEAITPPDYRFADCAVSGGKLFCVREDHSAAGEAKNGIAMVDPAKPGPGILLFGSTDFAAFPRVSPDGRTLAWIAWNHPNMPWDTTTLYVGTLTSTGLTNVRAIAGGHDEAVLEPRWNTDGSLYFMSDRTNWWNLYRWDGKASKSVTALKQDLASPLWSLGQANYALLADGKAAFHMEKGGVDVLATIDLKTRKITPFTLPYTSVRGIVALTSDHIAAIGASDRKKPEVITVDLRTGAYKVVRSTGSVGVDAAYIARPEPISFKTAGGATAYAFYYAPTNPAYRAPAGTLPPLLVKAHGGPTGGASTAFDVSTQFWTSRGFAVVDVDYRGSAGYGRAYRQALYGKWGVADVEDVVAATKYLVTAGKVDPEKLAIRGGSAGGYTTLSALAFTDTFKAGANYYGISDLETLVRDTHKFESRYVDNLVGPLPAAKALYIARSPIHHIEGFNEPLIVFQGLEDKVVPPSQSQAIVDALKARKLPVAYVPFAGEQHGFRQAANIIAAAQSELYFYARVFGFPVPADATPVPIDNLP